MLFIVNVLCGSFGAFLLRLAEKVLLPWNFLIISSEQRKIFSERIFISSELMNVISELI